MKPDLSYHDPDLGAALGAKYGGDRLEHLFEVEKLQLIGAIALWVADCKQNPEIEWLSLGDHAEVNGTVDQDYDAWEIIRNEADYVEPEAVMGFMKALVAQLDQGIWLEREE